MFGVEEFAAIINPPQSMIVAVGTVMAVVVSVDHRVVDGALPARWADAPVTTLEQPLRLLV